MTPPSSPSWPRSSRPSTCPTSPLSATRTPGLRKRAQWEQVWEQQREEDRIGQRLDIKVPPKYTGADFLQEVPPPPPPVPDRTPPRAPELQTPGVGVSARLAVLRECEGSGSRQPHKVPAHPYRSPL
ncbi:DUF7008 domain-containing protein [Streptomyces sp. NPDC054813]